MTDQQVTSWTSELETQIKNLGNYCRGYIWMHRRDIEKLLRSYNLLNRGSIGVSALSGAAGAASLGTTDNTQFVIISMLLAFLSSIGQGVLSRSGYAERIADLQRQIIKYSGILNNIRRQLALPRDKRERAGDYHRWITHSYDSLGESALPITDATQNEYRVICTETKIPYPDDAHLEAEIIVHVDRVISGGGSGTAAGGGIGDPIGYEIPQSPVTPPAAPVEPIQCNEYTDTQMQYELRRMATHDEDR